MTLLIKHHHQDCYVPVPHGKWTTSISYLFTHFDVIKSLLYAFNFYEPHVAVTS